MTDTPEAVRLADDLAPIAGLMPGGNIAKVVALLRRIPELEAERDQLRAELEKVRVPEGWKLVPVKPTEKMVEVGYAAINCKATSPTRLAWNAMITAAPTPPHADQKGQ